MAEKPKKSSNTTISSKYPQVVGGKYKLEKRIGGGSFGFYLLTYFNII